MTDQELRDAIAASPTLQAKAAVWDHAGIVAEVNAAQPDKLRSLTTEEFFNVLFASGDLAIIQQAVLAGNATAVMADAVMTKAKTLGPGLVDLQSQTTINLMDAMQGAGQLQATTRTALTALATYKDQIDLAQSWRVVGVERRIET